MSPGVTTHDAGSSTTRAPSAGQVAADARDAAAVDQDVERAVAARRRIDEVDGLQQQTSCVTRVSPSPPASRYSTAMRTATPLAT